MPGSPQGLKDNLMRAIDDSGNVLDMLLLVQVITDLESAVLTAEDLTVTRLGLYINNVRRKTADKSLAKRMKDLLKDWKQLVQQQATTVQQSNGIAPPIQSTTPKLAQTTPTQLINTPTSTLITPIISESSSNLTYVASPKVGVASKPTSALSHRKLLLNKLSAVKPQATPTVTPLVSETSEGTHLTNSVVASPLVAVSNGKPSNELTVRLPLKRLSSWQQEDEDLVVHIPLSLVHVGGEYNGRVLSDDITEMPLNDSLSTSLPLVSSSLSFHSNMSSNYEQAFSNNEQHFSSLSVDEQTFSTNKQDLLSSSIKVTEPLTVSIPLSLLSDVPQSLTNHSLMTTPSLRATPTQLTTTPTKGPPAQLITTPTQLIEPPPGCINGQDGIISISNGSWYYWTDSIPPRSNEGTTVLPYVYIDGLTTEQ